MNSTGKRIYLFVALLLMVTPSIWAADRESSPDDPLLAALSQKKPAKPLLPEEAKRIMNEKIEPPAPREEQPSPEAAPSAEESQPPQEDDKAAPDEARPAEEAGAEKEEVVKDKNDILANEIPAGESADDQRDRVES